jgi:purine catabolism regulator
MAVSDGASSGGPAVPREESGDPDAPTVRNCLQIPPLADATLVSGGAGLDVRRVRWMTVIEGPVQDFVSPGDFVLTTGLGYDETRLRELVGGVGAAGAAALVFAVGADAPLAAVPEDVRALGDEYVMPILELPWEVRFADVLRALTDRLLSARYAAALDAGDQLPAEFADALLGREGLDAIAEACEAIIDKPVLVLDAGLAVTAHGPLAAARLGDQLAAQPAAAHALEPATLAAVREQRDGTDVQWCSPVEEAGLPAGLCVAAVAQGSTLGYVLAADDDRPLDPLIVERHALAHAAVAVAIEMLRRRAVADAEARARGDFLWELASGASAGDGDLATKAALLGYTATRPYRVMLVKGETASEDELDELARHLRRQGALAGLQASRRGDRVLVLLPPDAPAPLQPGMLARRSVESSASSWGIAKGEFMLTEIAEGVRHAERALRVARALDGAGTVADAEALGPFLMLDALAGDEAAQQTAAAVLAPLEAYDEDTARGLIETLETFLRENGNTSQAARSLFLNRHSLMYRLRKIEALTGRSLDSHDDRFILELSLRLRRMQSA